MNNVEPGMFGIPPERSNRDLSQSDDWGKNKFASCFPTSLLCYMHATGRPPVYLTLDGQNVNTSHISVPEMFGIEPDDPQVYFSFETPFALSYPHAYGNFPKSDLVIGKCLTPPKHDVKVVNGVVKTSFECEIQHLFCQELKLTLDDVDRGAELVVRNCTIWFITQSIVAAIGDNYSSLLKHFDPLHTLFDLENGWNKSYKHLNAVEDVVSEILASTQHAQRPVITQAVWVAKGKSSILAKQCLDVFVWSGHALTKLFVGKKANMSRKNRSSLHLARMLWQYASRNGVIDYDDVVNGLSLGTKTDKAFAISGPGVNDLMECDEKRRPRISDQEIKSILLGGSHKFIRQERRLEGAICASRVFD